MSGSAVSVQILGRRNSALRPALIGKSPCHSRAEPALSEVERAGIQNASIGSWTPACAGVTPGLKTSARGEGVSRPCDTPIMSLHRQASCPFDGLSRCRLDSVIPAQAGIQELTEVAGPSVRSAPFRGRCRVGAGFRPARTQNPLRDDGHIPEGENRPDVALHHKGIEYGNHKTTYSLLNLRNDRLLMRSIPHGRVGRTSEYSHLLLPTLAYSTVRWYGQRPGPARQTNPIGLGEIARQEPFELTGRIVGGIGVSGNDAEGG